MTSPDAAEHVTPDFTVKREPITFTIDGDTFSAPALTAPYTLKRLAAVAGQLGDLSNLTDMGSVMEAIDALGQVMSLLMPGASGKLFKARLESEGRDADSDDGRPEPDPAPIDLMTQAIPAFYYLMERKGLRPTVPFSPSPTGSTDGQTDTLSDGTSSTAGASPTDSGPAAADSTSPTGSI